MVLVHVCEGELWTQNVCICIQRQNQIMHTSRGSSTSLHEYLWANNIYLANSCVVIKHQKGGDWKSISRVNDILVFVVNTRVLNRLIKCEGLVVNDSEFINPSKVKRSKLQRPRFSVVYFRSPYYQEGLLDEKLVWNQILHSLTPLCNMVERTLQKSCLWRFSGRRLRALEPETPSCKGRRLWLWARDSGQRIWPPKLVFHPSGASLCCPSGVF
jgi:hypothetical protein